MDEQGSTPMATAPETEAGTAGAGRGAEPADRGRALRAPQGAPSDLAQGIGADLGLTGSDVMALLKLEAPMTMKDLGLKIGCDPSFVTSIADALESHGLARREPSQRDRRSKNIVLTPEGEKVRARVCDELFARAPWSISLDTSERRCLLGLMRKMLRFREGR